MQETPVFEKAVSNRERKIVPILGIFVDSASKERALNRACLAVSPPEARKKAGWPSLVVTPNPEIIAAAQKDKSLARILNSADLALPDGIGVVMAMRYLMMGPPRPLAGRGKGVFRPIALLFQGLWVGLSLFFNRKWLFGFSEVVPGRWLFEELVRRAAKQGVGVFLLGGKPGVAEKAANALSIKYEVLNIKYNSGPWLNLKGEPVDEEQKKIEKKVIQEINKFRPDFLFVGFGHPKQEKWLSRNLSKLNVGAAMTVGGAFDYLAGEVPKPPKWLAEIGLEWLWRAIAQPARIKRIFNAVVVFPLKIYLYKLSSKTQ